MQKGFSGMAKNNNDWSAVIAGIPMDAAHAFQVAARELFGEIVADPQYRKDMAGNQIRHGATTFEVRMPNGDSYPVIMGRFRAGDYPFPFSVGPDVERDKFVLRISSEYISEVQRLKLTQAVTWAQELLKTQSLFRGKAVRLIPVGASMINPEVLDVTGYTEDKLIFPEATQNLLRRALFYPLRNVEACRKRGVKLKRGLMLGGKWGTGKTLTARVAASIGTAHGWTFFYCADSSVLSMALRVARSYQPALIFVEDIDDALENRDQLANDILNTLDGITSKDDEIMVVLTTNFLDRVDPALLRPGRMDTSIEMPTPDTGTVRRMLRTFAPDLVIDETPLSQFAEKLQGQIPAVIAEVVERARLIAMEHNSETIRGHHLGESIESMLDHMERLNRQPSKQQSLEHEVGSKIKELWKRAYNEA
jgi:hypothetical protein